MDGIRFRWLDVDLASKPRCISTIDITWFDSDGHPHNSQAVLQFMIEDDPVDLRSWETVGMVK